jgi:hypothetical protein
VLDNFSPHLSTKTDTRVGDWAEANNVEVACVPFYGSWLNRIEAQFTALRYVALVGTDHRREVHVELIEQAALQALSREPGTSPASARIRAARAGPIPWMLIRCDPRSSTACLSSPSRALSRASMSIQDGLIRDHGIALLADCCAPHLPPAQVGSGGHFQVRVRPTVTSLSDWFTLPAIAATAA